ncbi:MAG: hypothetical protein ISQ34_00120 [Rickettsiales bacterium]|nr:hypothetical protein [Rickettsiales bacterium]
MRTAYFTKLPRRQNINRTLSSMLDGMGIGYASIYQARLYSSESGDDLPMQYTKIKDVENDEINRFSVIPAKLQKYPKGLLIDPRQKKVFQIANQDISLSPQDTMRQLVVFSKDGIDIKYAKRGVAASRSESLEEMLKKVPFPYLEIHLVCLIYKNTSLLELILKMSNRSSFHLVNYWKFLPLKKIFQDII